MRVLRLPLWVADYQGVALPVPARVLHVAPARTGTEQVDVWFLEEGDTRRRGVGIYIVGTGHPLPNALSEYRVHLGTAVMPSGLVWHVFEGPVQL